MEKIYIFVSFQCIPSYDTLYRPYDLWDMSRDIFMTSRDHVMTSRDLIQGPKIKKNVFKIARPIFIIEMCLIAQMKS